MEVSIARRRPRVMTMRGGGAEGACGRGAVACSQASQCGLLMKPSKGFGARRRLGRGGGGARGVGHAAAESLGHTQWSMTHSQTSAISVSWLKNRCDTMAKPPHIRGEMRAFYPVCQVAEIAAGYRDTTQIACYKKAPFLF